MRDERAHDSKLARKREYKKNDKKEEDNNKAGDKEGET